MPRGPGCPSGASYDEARPITIRRATLADLPTIQHHRDAMLLELQVDPGVVARVSEPARAWTSTALSNGTYVGLLAVLHDEVVGGCGLTWLDLPPNMHTTHTRRGYVLNMYVEPGARRQGLARRLLDAALDACRDAGVDSVTLHASEAGRSLYESVGFAPTNELRLRLTGSP